MNDNLYYICNDIYVNDESYVTNEEISHYLRSNDIEGEPETTRAAIHKTKLWPKDSILNVIFLGGEEWQKAWVEKVVKEQLEPYTNIKFSFDPEGKRTIRISFKPNDGAYSAVGTDALMRSLDQPTMNLGWLDAPGSRTEPGNFTWKGKTYKVPAGQPRNKNENGATVMHEFGHALGFIHEHQNPRGEGIKWDANKVYNLFSGPPNKWDRDTIFRNILKKYNENQINGSRFDPDSIMLYFFDGKLTTDGKGTHMNTRLSDLDKKWLKHAYAGTKFGTDKSESTSSTKSTSSMIKNTNIIPSTSTDTISSTPVKQQQYVEYNNQQTVSIPAPKKNCKKKTKQPQPTTIIYKTVENQSPPVQTLTQSPIQTLTQSPIQTLTQSPIQTFTPGISSPQQTCIPPQQQQTCIPPQQQQTCMPLPVAASFLNSLLAQQQPVPNVSNISTLPNQVYLPPNVPCPSGYSRDITGICTLQPCPPGQYRDSTGNCVQQSYPPQQPCPPGYTRDGNGNCVQQPVQPCPPGYTRDGNGNCVQQPVQPCPPGYTKNVNGVCVRYCAPGYTRNAAGVCVRNCAPGYTRNAAGVCVRNCAPGYTRNAAGRCVRNCPPGYTRNAAGRCVRNCPPGYTRNAAGRCVRNCPPGYTRNAAGGCVRNCAPGYTRNAAGVCVKNCPYGQFKNAAGKCVKPGFRNDDGKDVIEHFNEEPTDKSFGFKISNKMLFLFAIIIIIGIIMYMMRTPESY